MAALAWELVTDAARLADVSALLRGAPLLAVDTEFVRRTTFYARPGLLQLSAGHGEFLVDLVAIEDRTSLRELFLAELPLKVMHSCSEDLEVLKGLFGAVPGSLVDTQVAAAMLGHPLQTSYQKLVKAVLDIDVPKDETQSDWTARPLSEAQLSYAALDVRHLLPLWQRLADGLAARDRMGWLQEDCTRLLVEAARESDQAEYYRGIANAGRLSPPQLALLSALAAWRERMARTLDKPRAHVVPDSILLMVAQRRPQSLAQLRTLPDFHPAALRRFGDDLLQIVATVPASAALPALPPPLPREAKGVLSALRDVVGPAAKAQGVEPEVLVRRRHLEALVDSARRGEPELPEMLAGWRRPLVGEPLLAATRDRVQEIRSWPEEGDRGR
ncbi:MAG: ribonuclease D [Gammaproteobacteria bacterium]